MKEVKKGKDRQMKPKENTNSIKTNTRLGRSKLNKWVLGEEQKNTDHFREDCLSLHFVYDLIIG